MKSFIVSVLVVVSLFCCSCAVNKVEEVSTVENIVEVNEIISETADEVIEFPKVEEVKEPETFDFTLTFTGDVLIASQKNQTISGSFNEYANNNPPSYFLEKVKPIFEQDDYTIVNLENVLSDNNLKEVYKDYSPAFWFRSKTSNTEILTSSSVEVASLSNNHYGDYGTQGQTDTKNALDNAGVIWGYDNKTVYLEKNGYKIALICNGLWGEWQADAIINRIKEAESQSDFQIVYFHGGKERLHKPEDWKVRACKKLVDNGADLVIGNHPHVLQPTENYNDVDIVYSLGNFCFGGNTRPENRTIIYQYKLTIDNNKIILNKEQRIIPCYVYTGNLNNYQPTIVEDTVVGQKILDFMNWKINSPV